MRVVASWYSDVAGGGAHQGQRIEQGHAGGEHGGQGARPAGDRRACAAAGRTGAGAALAAARARRNCGQRRQARRSSTTSATSAASSQYHDCTSRRDSSITSKVGRGSGAPKLSKTCRKAGTTTRQDDGGDDDGDGHDGQRIHQRAAHLAPQGDGFFLVRGQARQQFLHDAGLFAGRHQVAIQFVKQQGELAEGLLQAAARFDIVAQVLHQLRHGRLGMALAGDVEGGQQRHAGAHHGGQLAREQRDILVRDGLAGRGAARPARGWPGCPGGAAARVAAAASVARSMPSTRLPWRSVPSHANRRSTAMCASCVHSSTGAAKAASAAPAAA